jgi:hypothetical protein
MTDKPNQRTAPTQQAVREARLAAELRANLKKRKALAREKSAVAATDPGRDGD